MANVVEQNHEIHELGGGYRLILTGTGRTKNTRITYLGQELVQIPEITHDRARHFAAAMTQPVAVSPTAEELAETIKALLFVDHDNGRGNEDRYWASFDDTLVTQDIQPALDAKLLEGVRLGLEAAATSKCDIPRHCIVDQPTFEIFDAGVDAKIKAIRALQPETIVKGDK